MPVGAFLLSPKGDHAGVYIGERIINSKCYNVVECTPLWRSGVQLSYVSAAGKRYPYKGGAAAATSWGKHGKLPWIDYSEVPVAPEPPKPPVETEDVIYYVKRGDNLSKIAVKFGTTIAKLVEWNGIKNPNLIYVNQKLIVGKKEKESVQPAPAPAPVPEPAPAPVEEKVYYTVKRGDNLSKIAAKYNTTVKQLVAWNNIKNANLIFSGQVLRVK